jgi:hypothetical protein
MKNPNDPIGNRTSDLPVCSSMPQPTVPPRNESMNFSIQETNGLSASKLFTMPTFYSSFYCLYEGNYVSFKAIFQM